MDQEWRLGPHRYLRAGPVPVAVRSGFGPGCAWALVRRDGEGPRSLLQVWEPRPPDKVLDTLREEFLQRFSRSEALDPGPCRLGFDPGKAWLLQELGGIPLPRLWARADRDGRAALAARIRADLGGTGAPRLLVPEVIGLDPGRVRAPRVLGAPDLGPFDPDGLVRRLEAEQGAPGPGGGERPWDEAPDLADGSRLRLHGRARELTYLKSLMLGLGAAIPMERVVLLQGEEGLGHDRLCDWAAAAAEAEGIWVADLDVYPGEAPGGLLERLLTELIAGLEAEFYAARPAVARALSRRLPTFAFLRGGRRSRAPGLDPEEIAAALEAAAFAQARHPRLVLVRGLERAGAGVPGLLQTLAAESALPWMLSARDPLGPEAKACLAALGQLRASATIILDRLEDAPIAAVLADLLGPHDLPEGFLAQLAAAGLGNPGLMQKTLELAQGKGRIVRRDGLWVCAPDAGPAPELQQDRVEGILLGRLGRLRPASRAAVEHLALADAPLGLATLGRALGLDADAVEEALHPAANAKLARVADGSARIASAAVRDLAIAGMLPGDLRAGARSLLEALGSGLAVRLQAFALDRGEALAAVLEGMEREHAGPLEAEQIVREAMALGPDRIQEARLWEFQADAWEWATAGDGLAGAGPGAPSDPALEAPSDRALEALARAIRILEGARGWPAEEASARLLRKRALLELRRGQLESAAATLRRASALLADHPFHPEQPRLRLALGRLQLGRGESGAALATLEAGLELLVQKGAGAGHRDQADLMLELGLARGEGARFQGALATLEPVRRLAEHDGDRRILARALEALGRVRLGMGQILEAGRTLQEALAVGTALDDQDLLAACHLGLGILHSCRQYLGPAQASLDSALGRFELLGDVPGAARARAWKARNLAALGRAGEAGPLLARVAEAGPPELGERAFLDGESAGFTDAWEAARRHYQAAANRLAHAGLVWRERLARLRCIQAEAREAPAAGLEPAWIRLEQLKAPVEGTGSRWLELEWHRAHAFLLCAGGGQAMAQTLSAWGEVMAGARELGFPALVLEAAACSSELLLDQGERLGAGARIQDALPSAFEWWARLPPEGGRGFLARADLRRFLRAAGNAGVAIVWPGPAGSMTACSFD